MRNSLFARGFQIAKAVWRVYFFQRSSEDTKTNARKLRQELEQLGSVFVKFGQFLSMRPDFLPLEYCDELFYLLEDVEPFSFAAVEKIFEQDFGKTPEKVFAAFPKKPFASASFGQVYKAKLSTGETVAVKVQRPHIHKSVQQDLRLMKLGAALIRFLPFLTIKPLKIVQEFEQWIHEELNYEHEIENAEEFYECYRSHATIAQSPQIYSDFCSPHILTSEFLEGISLNKILRAQRENDQKVLEKIEVWGFTPQYASDLIIKNFMRQFFGYGLFHADPHPANILFTPEKQLAYIDFGITGKLDKRRRLQCLRYTRFVLHGDAERATETLFDQVDTSRVKRREALKRDHIAGVQYYQKVFQQRDREEGRRHFLGKFLFDGLELMDKYGAVIPAEVFKFFRAIAMMESLIFFMNPDAKIRYLARKVRNFSFAYTLSEVGEIANAQTIERLFAKGMTLLEDEFLQSL